MLTMPAGTPSKVTVAPLRKRAPLIVTAVPPRKDPVVGFNWLMLGGGTYWKAPASVLA
jgi:hypothetical protein